MITVDRDRRDRLSRDTISWVILGLGVIAAPHLARTPAWITLLIAAIWCWRVVSQVLAVPLPGRLLLGTITFVTTIVAALSLGTFLGRDSGVALLNLMLALKLLELRRRRDAHVAVALGFFLATSHFLYSQSVAMVLYVLGSAVLLLLVLVELQSPLVSPRLTHLRVRFLLIVRLISQAMPLALVLFVVFPRLPGPLWSLPQDAHAGLMGLDDEMVPGRITQLAHSEEVAFRVRFRSKPPPLPELYWRGPVFSYTDGVRWSVGPGVMDGRQQIPTYQARGEPTRYQVTLEPHGRRWLFALDLPAVLPSGAAVSNEFKLFSAHIVTERLRYEMVSYLDYRTGALDEEERARALQRPERLSSRVAALAERWRAAAKTPRDVVDQALRYFRVEPFVYTLSPPLPKADPIDAFLFETRRGFCEHYSAAFTLLVRVAGIPARVVTGYQGAERNPVGDYWIVRQSDAHAWSEVWLPDTGWLRVDPTAAVAPERIEQGSELERWHAPELFRFRLGNSEWLGDWVRQWKYRWDAIHYAWHQWVLGYGPQRQYRLLSSLGLDGLDWQGLGVLMGIGGAIVLGILAGLLLRVPVRGANPIQRTYERFCRKLNRRELPRAPWEGPLHYAQRITNARPDLTSQVSDITALYVALRYESKADPNVLARFQRLVRRFRP